MPSGTTLPPGRERVAIREAWRSVQIKILGSAAAEGIPALWCECETCGQAREKGGKDIRQRASYLIDDDTMVDFGPDVFAQVIANKIDLSKIRRLIFTHQHADHLAPLGLVLRRPDFCTTRRAIKIFAPKSVLAVILRFIAEDANFLSFQDINTIPVPVTPGAAVVDDDLEILPLLANHPPYGNAFVYVVSRHGRRAFIGTDTGWLPEESWELLRNRPLDLAILDGTMALAEPDCDGGHMGARVVVKFAERLKAMGALAAGAQLCVSHFSHGGKALHDDLRRFFEPHQIRPAYDGLTLTTPDER